MCSIPSRLEGGYSSFFRRSGWATREREKKNIAPYVSEVVLGVCRMGDGIGWGVCFLGVFRDGDRVCLALGFGRAGRRWGKVLGVFRVVFSYLTIFLLLSFLILFCPMFALSACSDLVDT